MIPYLDKRVDSHDGHVWLALGVVHEVEIYQLLQLQVIGLHAVHNVWEKGAEKGHKEILEQGPKMSKNCNILSTCSYLPTQKRNKSGQLGVKPLEIGTRQYTDPAIPR